MTEDRRISRTQHMLEQALAELIQEKGYDAVTVQDITDRANVGRTTFYLHYRGKDDLFLSSHLKGMKEYRFGIFSREEMLGDEPPPNIIAIFEYLKENRSLLHIMKHTRDADIIVRAIQENVARNMEVSLHEAFGESESAIPLDVLANYIARSQIRFMEWWAESHARYTAEEMAHIYHRLQRAAIREALGLTEQEAVGNRPHLPH